MAAPTTSNLQRTFYSLAILALVTACLYWMQTILVPVALAILLAFILNLPVEKLERLGFRRVYGVLWVVLLTSTLLGGISWILTAEVHKLAMQLPTHKANIIQKLAPLQGLLQEVKEVEKIPREVQNGKNNAQGEAGESNSQGWAEKMRAAVEKRPEVPDPNTPVPVMVVGAEASTFSWLPAVVQPLIETLAKLLLVVVLVIFVLIKREDLRNRLIRLVGHGQLTSMTRALDDAAERVSRYLLRQLGTNTCLGLGVGVGLYFIGIPFAFLWGFLAMALRFIPYMGVWLAAILPFTLSVAIFPSWKEPLEIFGLFLVLELLFANVIEPLWFGHGTGISPIALLVAAVFWTWLWGPIGLLMSTPLTVCLVVLGKYVPHLAFLDVLLGDEPVLKPAVRYYQRLLARDQDEATLLVENYLKDHPCQAVYDEIFIPTLIRARNDWEREELTAADEQFVFQVTRDLLVNVLSPQEEISLIARGQIAAKESERPAEPAVRLMGLPANGAADELALEIFQHLLQSIGAEIEQVAAHQSIKEMVAEVDARHPDLVCIAALPPGGLAQARNLCKRLRAHLPDLKIVVGRWGQKEDLDQVKDLLTSAGANQVGTSLVETRDQIRPVAVKASELEENLAIQHT